ncbi:MAG: hypothetical protein ACFFD1_03170, partial [Candidatus Thorarchaeota archaeon]
LSGGTGRQTGHHAVAVGIVSIINGQVVLTAARVKADDRADGCKRLVSQAGQRSQAGMVSGWLNQTERQPSSHVQPPLFSSRFHISDVTLFLC